MKGFRWMCCRGVKRVVAIDGMCEHVCVLHYASTPIPVSNGLLCRFPFMPYSLSSLDSLPCLDRFPPVIGIVVILLLAVLFAYGYYQFKGVVAGMGSAKAKHNLTTLNNLFYRFFFLAVIVLIMIVLCKYLAMKLLRLRYGMLYALRQRQNTCPPHYVPKPVMITGSYTLHINHATPIHNTLPNISY